MIFNNKNIDYSSKSKIDLYGNILLFYLISNKHIVYIGKKLLDFAILIRLPISYIIKKTFFKYFCGGESIKESQNTIFNLGRNNIKTVLDYSVEGKQDENSFSHTYNEILNNLDEAYDNTLIPFSVFKITGLARYQLLEKLNNTIYSQSYTELLTSEEIKEFHLIIHRLNTIGSKGLELNIPILIDAEESWIQNTIDYLTENLMSSINTKKVIIFNTIQLYRKDKLHYLKKLHTDSVQNKYKLGVKLVRGAYMEKEHRRAIANQYPSPIHTQKEDCDNDFNKACTYCLNHIDTISVFFGTHNELSTSMITTIMKDKNILKNDNRVYFSQLLGMSDNITFSLAKEGYNTAKYIPYGPVKEVMPYLIRRAEENSAISGQTNKEIIRIREALSTY
jgi:proline dehydrogenase